MPRFEPFRAIRYASDVKLSSVVAPPYDVLSEDDANELRDSDPHNIVWIDVPDGGKDRYDVADYRLHEWLDQGVLDLDQIPSLTIYRMSFVDATGANRVISGVFGGLEVVDEGAGGVLPHENTTKKAKTDRLDLTRATGMNMSAVWGLSLAKGLTEELAEPGIAAGHVEIDGVVHSVEIVQDPARIERICKIISGDDVLIADGHHRYAISRTYRDEVRKATKSKHSEAELTLTFVNELIDDQLAVEAIHRLYDGISIDRLKGDLSGSFTFEDFDGSPTAATLDEMVRTNRLVLIDKKGKATWLVPRPGAFDGVRSLDGAWLEHALAGSEAEVTYQHGLDHIMDVVKHHTAAILIRPTSLAEIERTAREHALMPPKSTFFTPKLLTGLVIRPTARLDDEK